MSYTILGKKVEMPVEVRTASAFMALYSVPSTTAQSIVDYTGLTVLQYRPGRALCGLVFVDYIDGDLGPYNEFGVTYMVRSHTAPPETSVLGDLRSLAAGTAGALIHELPVDGEFTKPPAGKSGDSRRCSPSSTPSTSARSSADRSLATANSSHS